MSNETCQVMFTEYDSFKEVACGKKPTAWCCLRDIFVCRRCCESCYSELYPEGCMEAKNLFL
jgi:hypothetical protein